MSFRKGSAVWVQDNDRLWEEGEVVNLSDKVAIVEKADGKKVILLFKFV